ncbi:tachylectin-related carbohydrate-binding protein [Saccharothrix deserti]|uniref:tachylectin-related carbohydrate-binding protein n=1 Tax=Saccharothrix deserti TaxID=2593674 RepID=UPI00131D5317|nr:tachylectin-related carbohydrate-binding protein [Saccharothrix deserti]
MVGLPVLTSAGNVANAVETAQCAPTANVFVAMTNSPALRIRPLVDPASGRASWTEDAHIGNGWETRFFAGANGYVFYIREDGSLQRHRWINGGWADGGVSKEIATGWTGWEDPSVRYRVTADANNHIYTVGYDGNLALHVYDEATGAMARTVIASGWGKYDQIFAAGDGVLYARDPAVQFGTLYRFHYDADTATWLQQDKNVGWGWNGFKQMASPGADIVYGMEPGGNLWWYRYLPAQDIWTGGANSGGRENVGPWSGVDNFMVPVDSCKLGQVATDVQCKPSADFFASLTNNQFHLRPHAEPETGLGNWTTDRHIGNEWNSRFLSGANGYKYIIRTDGALHRHHWNGTSWANGGVSEQIATGWTGWDDPRYHFRITVDSNNHFYGALAVGDLQHSVYDDVAKTWTQTIIDTGWGKYDQVFAAGDGVLYARDPAVDDGTLYRYHYDWKNRRWLDYATRFGTGWNGYKQIVSPGADIIYGVYGNGDVYWYRYDPVTKKSVHGAEGTEKEYVLSWPGISEVGVDIDACKLVSPAVVTPPAVPAPNNERAHMVLNSSTQRLEIAFVSNSGVLQRGNQSATGSEQVEWQALSGFQGHSGQAALAQRQDGRLVAMARDTGAQTRAYTQNTTGSNLWTGPAPVNGALSSSPVLMRGANGHLIAFAVDGARLWYSEQFSPTGEFKPWRQATSTTAYNMTGEFTVVPSGDGFEIAYRAVSNVYAVKKFTNGVFGPTRVAGGITAAATPGAVVFADGKVQLVVRAADNRLYTQKEGATGFSGTGWTDISAGRTFVGAPSALLNVHGVVEAVARDSDRKVVRNNQTAPGSASWGGTWLGNVDEPSVTDPTFVSAGGTEQRVFFLDDWGNYYLWQITAATSTSSGSLGSSASSADQRGVAPAEGVVVKGRVPADK